MTKTQTKKNQKSNPLKDGIFYRFTQDLARVGKELNQERFNQLCLIIGYLVTPEDTFRKGIIFNNHCFINELSFACLFKGIEFFLDDGNDEFTHIRGDHFKLNDKFAFQEISKETQLIMIHELHHHYQFTHLIDHIRKPFRAEIKCHAPFKTHPKMCFSTSKKVISNNPRFQDTFIQYKISDHLTLGNNPFDKYGRFFKDWKDAEFRQMHGFFHYCKDLYQKKRKGDKYSVYLDMIK